MSDLPQSVWQARWIALLLHPRLGAYLALTSTLLMLPTLWLGFHLDDHVHRYLFSDLPGAADLLRAYESPFGIANGDPAVNHWQIEFGYAPWWTHPQLLISLFRPLSTFMHQLDAWLWPASALPAHAHSLLWHALLVLCATALYRQVFGVTTVAGLAAIFYALDHCHGFAVGFIANRNVLIAAVFGTLCLLCQVRARTKQSRTLLALSALALGAALLANEGAIALFGYVLGYALFLDEGSARKRALSLLPHATMIVVWRIGYHLWDRGARLSGLYVDPMREPLRFAAAAFERIPLLTLGQVGLPPAETHLFLAPALGELLFWFAFAFTLWLLATLLPLLLRDRQARFWAFGAAAAIVAACSTHPHNRLLFFSGLGALALLSQLWHAALSRAAWLRPDGRVLVTLCTGFHLLVSPLLLPFTACSIALTSPVEVAARSLAQEAAGRDAIVITSPDYFHVKLAPVLATLDGQASPRRLRALSFGAVPLRIARTDAHTLDVRFEGGLWREPLLQLYRAPDAPMLVGSRVHINGMQIEITALSADQRVTQARFVFDAALDDARYAFLTWDGARFVPFSVPRVGTSVAVPAATLRFGL